MPGVDDWNTRPYSIIQKIFEENKDSSHESFVTQVEEYFNQRVNDESILKIPSLNNTSVDRLSPGCLVRYRCMVQDVFDPQFCLGQYVVKNSETQETRIECGSFRDVPNFSQHESVTDSTENKPIERQGFYCVPIPGEQDWVKQIYCKNSINTSPSSTSSSSSTKRKIDDDDDEKPCVQDNSSVTQNEKLLCEQDESGTAKVHREDKDQNESQSSCPTSVSDFARSFPLPGETGTPCIVRVYSDKVELRLTDSVEFIGILSVDPGLASIGEDVEGLGELMDQEELRAHEPPPSLVPRIHALLARMIDHNNPLLPPNTSSEKYKSEVNSLMQDSGSIRMELQSILQHALLGDALASEYLICHLLARVYARADAMALGKFSLNLSGCLATQRYTLFVNHLISQLTTKSSLMEMTIENMNSWNLVPKKDYKANRVTASMLQLASGTHVVLDETALQQGQLNNSGVMNVKALEELINWQKVDYDFQWSAVTIPTDVNVLILSECTSFLSKDTLVPMETNSVMDIPTHFSKLDTRLTEEILLKLRSYITACRLIKYEITEDLQKVIQDDFVETRQANRAEMTVEDFQRLLTLLRLLTLSFGLDKPSLEVWTKAKAMEEQRKARVAKLPKPSNGSQIMT